MKKLFLLALLALAVAPEVQAQEAPKHGIARTQTRGLSRFTAIEVTDGIQLTVREGKAAEAVVEASSGQLREMIKTVVEGTVLKVYFDSSADPTWKGLVNSREEFKVSVTTRELYALTASKGAEVTVNNVPANPRGDRFAAQLRSGARLAGTIRVQALDVQLRGGAFVRVAGSAATLNVRVTEGSRFQSPHLKADYCTAFAASASTARFSVKKSLDASAVNEATITYSGGGELTQSKKEQGGKIVRI